MLSSLTFYISLSNAVETASSNFGVALQRASRDVRLAAASLSFLFRSPTNVLTPLTDFVDRIPGALPIWLGPAPSYTKGDAQEANRSAPSKPKIFDPKVFEFA